MAPKLTKLQKKTIHDMTVSCLFAIARRDIRSQYWEEAVLNELAEMATFAFATHSDEGYQLVVSYVNECMTKLTEAAEKVKPPR